MNQTIYHCVQKGRIVYYGNTIEEAIKWLEENGGGDFYNNLHKYNFKVKAIKGVLDDIQKNG